MTTAKQLAANRKNALKSTGPASQEGKGRSSMNATKHGLLSSKALLSDEDPDEFSAYKERLLLALSPVGDLEVLLAEQIIISSWRIRRLLVVEAGLLKEDPYGYRPELLSNRFRGELRELQVLSRYEAGIERSLYRALHELQRIQAYRSGVAAPLPVAIDISSNSDE